MENENLVRLDMEEAVLKNQVLSKNNTFKTAFSATMGFYAAQFVATLLGMLLAAGFVGTIVGGIYLFSKFSK